MSNVVQFLEALGANPKSLSTEDFAAAVSDAELAPATQQILLSRNSTALNELLGGRPKMICVVAPAENDEPQDEEQEDENDVPEQEASIRVA